MKFDIFCDESCQDAFINKASHKYIGIGGIWIPSSKRGEFKDEIARIKRRFNCYSEFKWNKVSPNKEGFYKTLIDFFFRHDWIRFRIILLEAEKLNIDRFHNGDHELGYYKFYYQLLTKWITACNEYSIFLDNKENKNTDRLPVLRRCLSNSNIFAMVSRVQALPSHESVGIQLVDLLIGATLGKFNCEITSTAKMEIIEKIEQNLGSPIRATTPWTEKFNVFKINLEGGW